ncbi:MAG: hypothetical protein MJ060_05060 [Clostridia bacterium]|nr:hypothetical protein [Clostridia bacterium]
MQNFNITSNYEFQNCRDGFNHIGHLFVNGAMVSKRRVHYINRTWEVYNGQTARKLACEQWLTNHRNEVAENAKAQLNVKRATKASKELTEKNLAADQLYQAVTAHYESL